MIMCANVSRTHKIPSLIIDTAKKARCFGKAHQLPITYKGQKSAWMDRGLIKKWNTEVFFPELQAKHGSEENCLLLLDNAGSQASAEELNSISQLRHAMDLPPNVTALIRRMNQGVIEKTKRILRKNMLRRLLLDNDTASLNTFFKNRTILDA
ncbi:tigger transposable element-derived protein 2-like [Diachasma alloeum]|uniref:tigger transposable element-derived protein 2-like n=1 Tax=Diachasma alloeum TaxID=454923 RepID=UPI0007381CFE|nr:tigger transposable element-derived protein 2-like [Diachasma alloeum]